MISSIKTRVAVALLLVFATTTANAQSLVQRAAEVFENGCLSQVVLSLGDGSLVGEVAAAVYAVDNVFFEYAVQGKSRGLEGESVYIVNANQSGGRFVCTITSKDLTTRQLVRHFDRLSHVVANGSALPPIVPPHIDGRATTTYIEGQRRVFLSKNRAIVLEAIFFQGDRGPVGAFSMSFTHRIGN